MPFQKGNKKLGKRIWLWSIPAGDTCPGKTEACSSECYAQDGFFLIPNVKKSLEENWKLSMTPEFVDYAIAELTKKKAKVCRIHVAGDFYDKEYTEKWYQICHALPNCRFFVYSRSWRVAAIRPMLVKIGKLKNVKMWWSVDKDTAEPERKPKSVRLAYMQVAHTDIPAYPIDLTFRVDRLYNQVAKKVNDAMVCPTENGVNKDMTCSICQYCFKNNQERIDWSSKSSMIPLRVC